jgi:hypothetical protein
MRIDDIRRDPVDRLAGTDGPVKPGHDGLG